MRDLELEATGESLKAVHRHVLEMLVVAEAYIDGRAAAGDPLAGLIATRIDEAFTALEAEGIHAASLLGQACFARAHVCTRARGRDTQGYGTAVRIEKSSADLRRTAPVAGTW